MNQTELLQNRRIGDIVAENYHAAGVFREFGIDFCCGGGRELREVCKKRGIKLQAVTQRLEHLPWEVQTSDHNYNEWDAGFLIDYIINTHHRYVRKKTDEISAYAAKVARVHGENHPENIEIFKKFSQLGSELIKHLESEENSVFPLIKKLSQHSDNGETPDQNDLDTFKHELGNMVSDHDEAGKLIAEIRGLSNNFTPPADACTTYRILYQNLADFEKDLHKHVHLENNILFRKAEKLVESF